MSVPKQIHSKSKPWYREPWPWFLMAGPIIVVIAGLATFYIAKTHSDPLVTDDYYTEGKNIGLQLQRDQAAIQYHIQAQVLLNPAANQARVFVTGKFNPQDTLNLLLIHPTQQQYDQTVTLNLVDAKSGLYEATLKPLPSTNSWYVRIENVQQKWRVQEKWIVSQGSNILLKPMHESLADQ